MRDAERQVRVPPLLRRMCGIAGLITYEPMPLDELRSRVMRMGRAQQFRGPNGHAVWAGDQAALGCVRLAVTGTQEQGRQPIEDRWGGLLVFNGEIYEHQEILRRLGESVVPGDSDGVALSSLLALRGPQGLAGVRGMFAAARYDPVHRRILLIRDAVGKKPLYVRQLPAGWAFASTLVALHAVTGPMQVRQDAIWEYLVFRSIGGNRTAFNDIEQLPPGSWLELGTDGYCQCGRWWHAPPDLDLNASTSDVRESIDAAVAARVRTERKLAIFLSGGLDSAIVAESSLRQRDGHPVHLLSIGYDVPGAEDERNYARRLARTLAQPIEELTMTADQVPELMDGVARLTEDPIQDPVTLPTFLLAKAAARHTKVVLTGDGSDEVWGGYERFNDAPPTLEEYLPRTAIFQPVDLGLDRFPVTYLDQVYGALDPGFKSMAPLDAILRMEVANRLRNYHLARLDKVTMGFALEARCPFLDERVVSLGLSIQAVRKRPGGKPKGLLISAFQGALPQWLLAREKQPFSVPIRAWLQGPLRDFASGTLLDPNSFCRSFTSPERWLSPLTGGYSMSDACASRIWSLLQLEVWHKGLASDLGLSICQ